jgi:hypothetical protein
MSDQIGEAKRRPKRKYITVDGHRVYVPEKALKSKSALKTFLKSIQHQNKASSNSKVHIVINNERQNKRQSRRSTSRPAAKSETATLPKTSTVITNVNPQRAYEAPKVVAPEPKAIDTGKLIAAMNSTAADLRREIADIKRTEEHQERDVSQIKEELARTPVKTPARTPMKVKVEKRVHIPTIPSKLLEALRKTRNSTEKLALQSAIPSVLRTYYSDSDLLRDAINDIEDLIRQYPEADSTRKTQISKLLNTYLDKAKEFESIPDQEREEETPESEVESEQDDRKKDPDYNSADAAKDETEGSGMNPGKGLYSSEIDKLMARYPEYLGTIAHDQIQTLIVPQIKPKSRGCFIINTDDHTGDGQHWQAIFFDARPQGSHSIEFFDSYGDNPDQRVLKDLLAISRKLEPEQYLKLKVNKIRQQNATSANCGWFCIKFLMDRLRGKPFADTTKFVNDSKRSEADIQQFKKLHGGSKFPYMLSDDVASYKDWILQDGEGFIDDAVGAVKEGFNRVVNFFKGQRENASPALLKWMEANSGQNSNVVKLQVVREPIQSAVRKLMDFLSGGKVQENLKKMNYDDVFHLYLRAELADGTKVRIESTPTVEVRNCPESDLKKKGTELVDVSLNGKQFTLPEMIKKAVENVGKDFWFYDPVRNNCQNHVAYMLKAMGLYTEEIKNFTMQNAKGILQDSPLLEKVSGVITDLAARFDRLIHGGKLKYDHIMKGGCCVFCKVSKPQCGCGKSHVQAVLLSKSKFPTREAADEYIDSSQFKDRPIKRAHETEKYWRYRLTKPNYDKYRYRIIHNKKSGIDLIIGFKNAH